MSNTYSETRREVLRDSAALNRLLAAAIRAHLLGDEQRLENLLGQVTPGACDRLAALVASEATERGQGSENRSSVQGRAPAPEHLDDEFAELIVLRRREA